MNDEMKENENKCIVINNDLQVSVRDANSPINLSSIQPNLPVGINTLINEETNSESETAGIILSNEGANTADDISNENSRTETADINSYNENVGKETADNELSNESKVQTSIVKIQANDSTCSMLSEPGTDT